MDLCCEGHLDLYLSVCLSILYCVYLETRPLRNISSKGGRCEPRIIIQWLTDWVVCNLISSKSTPCCILPTDSLPSLWQPFPDELCASTESPRPYPVIMIRLTDYPLRSESYEGFVGTLRSVPLSRLLVYVIEIEGCYWVRCFGLGFGRSW